jgi:iron(III) transport system substrate-binding protein
MMRHWPPWESNAMNVMRAVCVAVSAGLLWTAGCGSESSAPADPRAAAVDRQVRQKWGKGLDELPTATLNVISPHNENIRNEFQWAFSLHHAAAYGSKVSIVWRDVGGGSTAVLRYLLNVYGSAKTSKIDVVWGGGQYNFDVLAGKGVLAPMALADDVTANIPAAFGVIELRDPNRLWCGSAISAFGFLYNLPLLKRAKIAPPTRWEDLAAPACFDHICMADPTQSGSAASAYEMIVQSEASWPAGWAKLLAILGNTKKIKDSASGAANAPMLGESALAACIDFYGIVRVAKAPDVLFYVNPVGQTAYDPDPIAILKNPPSAELAQRFVDFVLSRRGQALWALKVGEADGPIRSALGRQPIRRDVYDHYKGKLLPRVTNPYEAGGDMKVDLTMRRVRFSVLRQLVRAAAIDNLQYLRAARKKLIDTNFEPKRLAEYNRLPDNVAEPAKIPAIAAGLADKAEAERITTDWQRFFRDKYKRVAE